MFKHAFHGGPAVEIFSTTGKNPLQNWKTSGSITKSFDNSVKGYIYSLDGQAKIQLPKDEKDFLGLIQPFLVFQIFIPYGKNIHIEVDQVKTDFSFWSEGNSSQSIACKNPRVNVRSIDFLIVTASCKLRKIFTMRNPLYDEQEADDFELQQQINDLMIEEMRDNLTFEYVPKNLAYPQGSVHFNQFIFPHRLKHPSTNNHDENVNNGNNLEAPSSRKEAKVQLAFGQRVQGKSEQATKKAIYHTTQKGNYNVKDTQETEDHSQNDFYSAINSEQQTGFNENQYDQEDYDQDKNKESPKKNVKKEDLKEQTHFLYLQNNSDEESETQVQKRPANPPRLKNPNPWDSIGRQDHDVKPNKHSKNGASKQDQPLSNKKPPQDLDDNPDNFYSPLSIKKDSLNQDLLLDSQCTEDVKIQQQLTKVNEMSTLISNIEFKYAKAAEYQREQREERQITPEKKEKRTGKNFRKGGQERVKLQQEEEKFMDSAKYHNFDLEQWDTNKVEEDENLIEEAFDLNHLNLINFDSKEVPLKSVSDVIKPRKSKEFKENPMYIEFELNNDEDGDGLPQVSPKKNKEVLEIPKSTQNQNENNLSYQRLESSRKEERRPFSPPFKLAQPQFTQPITDFDKKIEYLKVQRTEILRDSLDQSFPKALQKDMPSKATVENEDGELLDVIYDPVLLCYYNPKSNSYYELKSQFS